MAKQNEKDFWDNLILTDDEKEIEESIDISSIKSTKNLSKVKKIFSQAARKYRIENKEKRITIRVNENDLKKVKDRAQDNNIPYQTLLGILIHKYARGDMKLSI